MSVRKSSLISFTFDNIYIYIYIYRCVCVCVCVKLKINPRIRNCTDKETGCPEDSSDCCIHLYCENLKQHISCSLLRPSSGIPCLYVYKNDADKQETSEESWRIQRPKHYLLSSNNKDEDNSPKITTKTTRTLFLLISTYIASIYLSIYLSIYFRICILFILIYYKKEIVLLLLRSYVPLAEGFSCSCYIICSKVFSSLN